MEARRDGYFLGLGAAEGLSLEQAAAKRAREDAKADQAMHLKRKKQESQLLSTTNARTWRWQSLGPAKAWFATGLPPTACAPLLQEQDRSFLLSRHGWFGFVFFLPLGHFKCLGHPSCLCLCCGRFSYSLEGLFHGRGNWGLHFVILLATEARRHQISILLAEVGVFETEVAHAPLHARLQATRASHDSSPEVGCF